MLGKTAICRVHALNIEAQPIVPRILLVSFDGELFKPDFFHQLERREKPTLVLNFNAA